MANRKRKRDTKKPEKFEWTVKQTAFLLAWLDYCVEKGSGRAVFFDTVVNELKKRWNQDFTERHVRNKLRSIHYHSYNSEIIANKSQRAILDKGTSSLDFSYLDQELKDALADAKAQLQTELEREARLRRTKTPRSTSVATSAYSRRLRSHDSTVEGSPGRGLTEVTFSKRSDRKSKSQGSKGNAHFKASSDPERTTGRGGGDRRQSLLGVTVVKDSDTDIAETDDEHIGLSANTREDHVRTERVPDSPSERPLSTLPESHSCPDRREPTLDEELATQASVIKELRLKVSRLTADNIRLHDELDALRVQELCWSRAITQSKEDDHVRTLFKQETYIAQLRAKLDKSTKLGRFVGNTAYTRYAPSPEEVQRSFESIFTRSKTIFQFNDEQALCNPQAFAAAPGTAVLLRRVFHEPRESKGCCNGFWKWPRNESAQHVAEAITNAALQDWVFEASWPDFDEGRLGLLRSYRECIASGEDGMKKLQAIDGAAHHMQLNEQAFVRIVVPAKAKVLAERLVDILAETFSKWLRRPEVDKILTLLLQEEDAVESLMNRALELKTKMLLCEHLYHLVHVEPGAAFDAKTMSTEMTDRDTSSELVEIPLTVKLCLSPGLSLQSSGQRSLTENTGMLSDWRHALVRYSISKQEEPGAETGIMETIACKAVVLLESKN